MGTTELEEGEEGSGGGGRLIKTTDFAEEHGRKIHGSRTSPRELPPPARNCPREDGESLAREK